MNNPFTITFDFPMDGLSRPLRIEAQAQVHHSELYYLINRFSIPGQKSAKDFLPPISIKCLKEGERTNWVHIDSLKESSLSKAVGEALEKLTGNTDCSPPSPPVGSLSE